MHETVKKRCYSADMAGMAPTATTGSGGQLVPLHAAAEILNIPGRTARKYAKQQGYLTPGVPVEFICGRWKVSRIALDRYLDSISGQAVAS